jgi:hypothetical protein
MDQDGIRAAAVQFLIECDWEITRCSCVCGGNFAWTCLRPSGARETYGCICHNDPIEIVKSRCAKLFYPTDKVA